MAGYKTPKPLPFWASANQDCKETRFTQHGDSLYMDKNQQAMSDGAFRLYSYMMMEAGGKVEFTFPASCAEKYGISLRSMRNHTKELIKRGFIKVVKFGRLGREPNVYKFSDRWRREDTRRPL